MNDDQAREAPLAVPAVERKHFARNFITQAVCELRFPTLFELEQERPPPDLAHALRKEYPTHERLAGLKLDANGGGAKPHTSHAFRSRKDRWTVNLRASTLSLETSHYDSFEEFQTRLEFVLRAAEKTIDADFFTRVGLRYINGIPCKRDDIKDWVNFDLVGPLASGIYGQPQEFSQRIVGTTALGGGFMFNHGLGVNAKTGQFQYVLDYDFFSEDIALGDAMATVKALHDAQHSLFRWSIGSRANDYLGFKN